MLAVSQRACPLAVEWTGRARICFSSLVLFFSSSMSLLVTLSIVCLHVLAYFFFSVFHMGFSLDLFISRAPPLL